MERAQEGQAMASLNKFMDAEEIGKASYLVTNEAMDEDGVIRLIGSEEQGYKLMAGNYALMKGTVSKEEAIEIMEKPTLEMVSRLIMTMIEIYENSPKTEKQ